MSAVSIRSASADEWPRHLLLLADPSDEMVDSYRSRGYGLVAEVDGAIVGVAVLIDTRPKTVELVNLAVEEAFQHRGIGRKLVTRAIDDARQQGFRVIELGTGNSGIGQLTLYQRCGFRIVGVDPDFFVRHYPEPIVENGIWCRDMVRLALDLRGDS